jgi:ribose transport system substrate-binding protein
MRTLAVACLSFAAALGFSLPASAGVDEAKALIEKYSKLPTFDPPGPAFDAKACMANKKMFPIPLTDSNPFEVAIIKGMEQAAGLVGFTLTAWQTELSPDQWTQGINKAVESGYQLVDLVGGLPPEYIAPQIQEAQKKGVKFTTTHDYDASTQKPAPFLDGSANTDYVTVGKLIAAWTIAKTGGKVNAVIEGPDEISPTTPLKNAIFDYFKENCPSCKYRYINTPAAEWATKIQPATQAALLADPTVNYVLPIYDSMSQFIVPAIQSAGSSAKIVSYNGTPFVLDMMRDGDMVEMNVGESLGWVGFAGVDADMRLLCGQPAVTKLNTPAYIFTKANVATAGNPANFNDGYGDAHITGFKKLWQLK